MMGMLPTSQSAKHLEQQERDRMVEEWVLGNREARGPGMAYYLPLF